MRSRHIHLCIVPATGGQQKTGAALCSHSKFFKTMQFKSLFLSASLLTVAAMFSFCTKESVNNDQLSKASNTGTEAGSRGTCKVLVEVFDANVDVCGSQTNTNVCAGLTGTDVIASNTSTLYTITTPATLQFSTGPVMLATASIKVTTTSGEQAYSFAQNGGVVTIDVSEDCVVH